MKKNMSTQKKTFHPGFQTFHQQKNNKPRCYPQQRLGNNCKQRKICAQPATLPIPKPFPEPEVAQRCNFHWDPRRLPQKLVRPWGPHNSYGIKPEVWNFSMDGDEGSEAFSHLKGMNSKGMKYIRVTSLMQNFFEKGAWKHVIIGWKQED